MSLTRLVNGSWIDLRTVAYIIPLKAEFYFGEQLRPRVIVSHGGIAQTVDLDFNADPFKYADKLANEVNNANGTTYQDE